MYTLKKIIFIISLSIICAFVTGNILDKGFHRFWQTFYDKMDVAFKDSTSYDVLFLGNSTVHFGIDPYYVDSITKSKTYNVGYGGANIKPLCAFFYGYLEVHPKPKAILISMEPSLLINNNDLSNYYLFFDYLNNKAVNNYLLQKGYPTSLIRLFPFLKYCYMDEYYKTSAIKGFSGNPIENNSVIYKGFINNQQNSFNVKSINDEEQSNLLPDSAGISMLNQLLAYCKNKNIKVIFIFPPRMYVSKNGYVSGTNADNTLIENIASQNNIPYKRYNVPGLFMPSEFSDEIHLNRKGSVHYSICVGEYIDSVLAIH